MQPFSIIPYWSLAYEVWYYLLFAALLVHNRTARFIATACILVAMGPKLWLLLPCWVFGVLAFRFAQNQKTTAWHPYLPSLLFVLVYAAALFAGLSHWQESLGKATQAAAAHTASASLQLGYSRWFLADTIVAALFALAVWATGLAKPGSRAPRVFAWLAPHTFGIYLLHYTILAALVTRFSLAQASPLMQIGAILAMLAFCIAASTLANRTRPWWRRLFLRVTQIL